MTRHRAKRETASLHDEESRPRAALATECSVIVFDAARGAGLGGAQARLMHDARSARDSSYSTLIANNAWWARGAPPAMNPSAVSKASKLMKLGIRYLVEEKIECMSPRRASHRRCGRWERARSSCPRREVFAEWAGWTRARV